MKNRFCVCVPQPIDDAIRALAKDLPALALEMGNSVAMIYRHYMEIVSEEEAQEYFSIRPEVPSAPKSRGA